MDSPTSPQPLELHSSHIVGVRFAIVAYTFGAGTIEPDLAEPTLDNADSALVVDLTNTSHRFLSHLVPASQVQDLFDRGVKRLTLRCGVSSSRYLKTLQLGMEELLNETVGFQATLPIGTYAGGRFEKGKVTITCAWSENQNAANFFLDFIDKFQSYSKKSVRLFRSTNGVVDEETGGKDQRPPDKEIGPLPRKEIRGELERLSAELFAQVSADPQQCLTDVETLATSVRAAAIKRLTPIFQQLLQLTPPSTLAEIKAVSSQLNRVMAEIGIAIKDPATGRACSVAVAPDRSGGGYFRLQAKKHSTPIESESEAAKGHASRLSSVTTKLPPLELMEAPRQERLAQFRS